MWRGLSGLYMAQQPVMIADPINAALGCGHPQLYPQSPNALHLKRVAVRVQDLVQSPGRKLARRLIPPRYPLLLFVLSL